MQQRVYIQSETTTNPLYLMGYEAGTCWNADTTSPEKNIKRAIECINSGHGRVMEYPQVFLTIEGFSIKFAREFMRHLGGAPTVLQDSTRYVDKEGFNFIIPKSIENHSGAKTNYLEVMNYINIVYQNMVGNFGIPKEDASMILPLGMETKLVYRTNLRALVDMAEVRECSRAFWEYRQFMKKLKEGLSIYSDEWKQIVDMGIFAPRCERLRYCPEKFSCGRKEKKK